MEPLRVGDVVRSTQPMNGSHEVAVSVQIGVGWEGKVQFVDDGGALIEFKDFGDGRQFMLRIRATEFERFAVQSHCVAILQAARVCPANLRIAMTILRQKN